MPLPAADSSKPTSFASLRRRRIDLAADVTEELHVRIGQMQVATAPGTCIAAIGLGSCIGVTLVHGATGSVAAAHVFLPDSTGREEAAEALPGKFADTAVPALVELLRASAPRVRPGDLQAVLIGGSQMFALGGLADASDVGGRNLRAVRAALELAGITVVAEDCGGSQGRTARVYAASCTVTTQVVGADEATIFEGSPAAVTRRAA